MHCLSVYLKCIHEGMNVPRIFFAEFFKVFFLYQYVLIASVLETFVAVVSLLGKVTLMLAHSDTTNVCIQCQRICNSLSLFGFYSVYRKLITNFKAVD
jgi:hypothetical protein